MMSSQCVKTRKYRAFVHGTNFLFEWETERARAKVERAGFYVVVFVEARDFKAAEIAAVDLLRKDETLKRCKNEKSDPPMLNVEGIQEVEAFDKEGDYRTGFAFYTGDESR